MEGVWRRVRYREGKKKKGKVKERRQKEEMRGVISDVVFCLSFLVCLQFIN